MPTFPTFDNAIITQRPWSFGRRFANQVDDIEHGPRTAFNLVSTATRVWEVNLPVVTGAEMQTLEDFFFDRHGRFQTFTFVDPNTGTSYTSCRFGQDELQITDVALNHHSIKVVVEDFTP